jgi:phenylalanyl-tRNA synthetase beta chain
MLAALGFNPSEKNGQIQADIPSWRADVEGEADLVEEVTRIYGFDRIAAVPLNIDSALPEPAITPAQRRVQISKRLLVSRGLMEAVTFSFMENRIAERFTAGNKPPVKLANPIAADLDAMRPSILPNLLQAAARNAARGLGDPALFEVGPQYSDDTPEGQATVAAGLRNGNATPRHWAVKPRPADAFDAKGDALALLSALGAPVENLQVSADAPGWYHPGRSGSLRVGPPSSRGSARLHPACSKELGEGRRRLRGLPRPHPHRWARARAPARRARCSRPRPTSRWSATSPSPSPAMCRRRKSSAPPRAPTRR